MRKPTVIIKSNAYGLILILDPEPPFEELKEAVESKFRDAARFFRGAKMALTFHGRKLSTQEEVELIKVIMNATTIDIVCIVDEDEETGLKYREAVVRAVADRRQWYAKK